MKNQIEIQNRINKEWQDICKNLLFCHSPDILIKIRIQGMMDQLLYEGEIDHWKIEDLNVNYTIPDYLLDAKTIILWRKQGSLSYYRIHLKYDHLEKLSHPETIFIKELSRWELILNEVENESPFDSKECKQENRINTSQYNRGR